MNYIKVFCLLGVLLICAPLYAQKKQLIKSAIKAATEARPYAQLLADTQALMKVTGYRPRACINDERGLRIAMRNMTPAQQQEARLAGVIARTLQAYKSGDLDANDPDLQALQTLVAANPNPRNNITSTPYLAKYKAVQQAERITDICTRTTQFIAEHGRRPRSVLFENGVQLSIPEIKKDYPQDYEEIHLGLQIGSLLYWGKKNAPDHPQINNLRQLVSLYTSKAPDTQTVLNDLRAFLTDYNRLPRKVISRNGRRLLTHELSAEEHRETLLAGRLNYLLNSARHTPALAEIKQLMTQYRPPMLSLAELLAQARAWVRAHNGMRPRKEFSNNGHLVPVRALSHAQYEEILLSHRIRYVIENAPQLTPEIEGLQQILQLPVRPQAADEFPTKTPDESPYDDVEEYF